MKPIKKVIYGLIAMLFVPVAQAQWAYKERLAEGRQQMEAGRYAEAQAIFYSISHRVQEAHPYVPMALLYGGVASYHLGEYKRAMQDLAACMAHYPQWKQPYALRYWMGRVYLALSRPTDAMAQWLRIPHGQWRRACARQIHAYAQSMSLDSLLMLQQRYPDEIIWVQALYRRWAEFPEARYDSIQRQLSARWTRKKTPLPAPKDAYQIALLLPFMFVNADDAHPYRSATFFTLDWYEGFQMGLSEMTTADLPHLSIRTYDTRRNTSATRAILEELALNPPDLIIGPLYEEPIALVQSFSLQHHVPVINPISLNPGFIAHHPLSFLLKASYALQHEAILQHVQKARQHNGLPATAALIYDTHPRSIAMAQDYKKRLDSARIQLRHEWKITARQAKRVYDELSSAEQIITSDSSVLTYADSVFANSPYTLREGSGQYGEQKEVWFREKWAIPPRAIGHVYVIATQADVLRYAMEAIERRPDTIPLFTQARWVRDPEMDYRQMERVGLHLVHSIEQPNNWTHARHFQQSYLSAYHHLPSAYSEAGYEAIRLIGRLLAQCGLYFQHPDCGFVQGVLSDGLHYGTSFQNQRVSIVRLQKGALRSIYQYAPTR